MQELLKKFQWKEGLSLYQVGEIPASWNAANLGMKPQNSGRVDAILLWVAHSRDWSSLWEKVVPVLKASGDMVSFWVAYPKGGALGTDLKREAIREWALSHKWDTVRQIAVDETWSAMRLRPA